MHCTWGPSYAYLIIAVLLDATGVNHIHHILYSHRRLGNVRADHYLAASWRHLLKHRVLLVRGKRGVQRKDAHISCLLL